jgi:hypothetical protein
MKPGRYLDLDFPERFDLQVEDRGRWWSIVAAGPEDFERQPDGSYVCSPGYTLVFIRCVEKHPGYFVHVDGDGQGRIFKYRLVPLPGSDEAKP